MDLKGKKLLVLGGTYASYDVVKDARDMGVYTIVTDYLKTGVAKEIADDTLEISTTDMDALAAVIAERKIDGVFCGPSEFNLRNVIRLCEITGLPCYTTMEVWDRCANKDLFTASCRKYGVDVPKEYSLHENMTDEELDAIEYPIIIKPVDRSSSVGISVCRTKKDVPEAFAKAMDASNVKRVVTQQYIENGGELFNVRYLVKDGKPYPYLTLDTYIADPYTRRSLISHFSITPSRRLEYYLSVMDPHVREMIHGIGIRNGTLFVQALPYKGRILFMEMGYRISGGLLSKLTEPMMGINDIKSMIRYALGGEIITDEELPKLRPDQGGRAGGQLMIPLNAGTIARIEGMETVCAMPSVVDFIQYYFVGGTVEEKDIGTLGQHFCRFYLLCADENDLLKTVDTIYDTLKVYDTNGNLMNSLRFDTSRVEEKN